VLSATGVPGLAASLVHRGEMLYARGFGVRDVRTGVPVDARTVFHLASVSKSLSSTVVAGLVGRRQVGWSDPVVKHLPMFALSDPYVTRHVTIADMFSHVSGLPDHAGDLLEDLGYDRAYILHALRLEKLKPFRDTYAYTNFGLTAGALAAARAAGSDWATIADRILFGPLAMSASTFRYADFVRRSNRAAMHVRVRGRWRQKYSRNADPEAPAGGASSNVVDLAKWMALKLADGRWKGRQVISSSALLAAATPRVATSEPASAASRTGFYGFGTNVNTDYSGRTRLSHSGAFSRDSSAFGGESGAWREPGLLLDASYRCRSLPAIGADARRKLRDPGCSAWGSGWGCDREQGVCAGGSLPAVSPVLVVERCVLREAVARRPWMAGGIDRMEDERSG
jgi:CubicO group peptidase (beta-lactamase class C family)